GQRRLQPPPPHALSSGETSPYGALTAFGLDPIYADVAAIEDLDAAAVEEALGVEGKAALTAARAAEQVDYEAVRALKMRAFGAAFARFERLEWERDTPRAKRLAEFVRAERGWLDDLALYETLRASHGGWGWTSWPEDGRERGRARATARRSSGSLTSSGRSTDSGRRPTIACATSASSSWATCPSSSGARAPTSGPTRRSSSSRSPSVPRPTTSRRTGKTGACRPMTGSPW